MNTRVIKVEVRVRISFRRELTEREAQYFFMFSCGRVLERGVLTPVTFMEKIGIPSDFEHINVQR